MAIISTNATQVTVDGVAYDTVTLVAASNITGVVLKKEIQNGVKVRPTNVTASIGTSDVASATTGDENDLPNYILLHNGPKGGFSQGGVLGAGTYLVNQVVDAIITQ